MSQYLILSMVVCFIIGGCAGSFLNVCIYRIPRNLSLIRPASFCPCCHSKIPFYCNIPVLGYLFLKGRCKICKQNISIRYPLLELLSGSLYALIFLKFGMNAEILFWWVFISVLIVLSFIDIDFKIIPDLISILGIFIFSSAFIFLPDMTLFKSLSGIFVGGGLLYAVAALFYFIRNKEGLGGGDIKLTAMIGAALGIKGVLFTIFCGSLLGAGIAMIMIAFQKKDIRAEIAFAPFLSAGALIYIFYGNQLINIYLRALL